MQHSRIITLLGTTPIGSLIAGLSADGILALCDRFWVFAQPTATLALTDFVAGATATAVNSPTFTPNQGFAGNGTTSYVNTNWAPSAGVQYTLNSAHFSVYVRNDRTTFSGTPITMGARDGASTNVMWLLLQPGTTFRPSLNSIGTSPSAIGAGDIVTTRGYHCGVRISSLAGGMRYYINGAAITLTGAGNASTGVSSYSAAVGAINSADVPTGFIADQVAVVSVGNQLSAAQAAALSNRVNTYMTAIGSNVY